MHLAAKTMQPKLVNRPVKTLPVKQFTQASIWLFGKNVMESGYASGTLAMMIKKAKTNRFWHLKSEPGMVNCSE